VLHGEWVAAGEHFAGGDHKISKPTAALVRLAAAAHAAGAIEVSEGLDRSVVQSQKQGEKAYAAAQADGRWREGHLVQVAVDALERGEKLVAVSDGASGPIEERDAKELLSELSHVWNPGGDKS
jgi:hypothetical protein